MVEEGTRLSWERPVTGTVAQEPRNMAVTKRAISRFCIAAGKLFLLMTASGCVLVGIQMFDLFSPTMEKDMTGKAGKIRVQDAGDLILKEKIILLG